MEVLVYIEVRRILFEAYVDTLNIKDIASVRKVKYKLKNTRERNVEPVSERERKEGK